ncbi:MAG: AAA family ATPase [Bacteroidaceae bacterium]|nr:AAA family ATPase [Bacteroidaceae bacterium]
MDDRALIISAVKRECPFTPTQGQETAICMLADFIGMDSARKVFLLCGYAGTGKTTIISAFVQALRHLHRRVVLLAPTGRAAKVFSLYSGVPAYTIHRKIYRQKSILDQSAFVLDSNLHENTLFLVDEASMISNEGLAGSGFGTGRLLDDLISYVFSGKSCSLLMLGDIAQLPPVGETVSPALEPSCLRSYGLDVMEHTLTEVVRQDSDSGILYNATRLRDGLPAVSEFGGPDVVCSGFKLVSDGFSDVKRIRGDELVECISNCYNRGGISDTIVLCRSNRRAIIYNNGIRNTILDREDELCRGDQVMVVKNNYYWTEKYRAEAVGADESPAGIPSFIANGDIATIRRVRNFRELYGFNFATVQLSFPDYDDFEMETTVILDTLHSEAPALTKEEQNRLFSNVLEDYADIPDRRERMKRLRQDSYFNALQLKYAYAVTCHKAQGGQWSNVFIDQGYVPEDGHTLEYYRWLYTALTRATGTVYFVNWPEDS